MIRPEKELRDFAKVHLQSGETKTVIFKLNKRSFAYYNTELSDWHVESGNFRIMIGKSSREIVCETSVYVESTVKLPVHYTADSTVGDLLADMEVSAVLKSMFDDIAKMLGGGESGTASSESMSNEMIEAMMSYMPLRGILSFVSDKGMDIEKFYDLVDQLNRMSK